MDLSEERAMNVQTIDAKTAKSWIEAGDAILVDVREPAEHAAQNIAAAQLGPLNTVNLATLPKTDGKIIIHCQKGMRGNQACEKLLAEKPDLKVFNLEGGIESWQQAGFATRSSGKKHLPLDRQVQMAIGSFVLGFSLLGYFVNPNFIFGAAFFGAGLLNAGLTGWCGFAKLMAKMPWNR
jgi:rhodanese-related sulfurtransferase